MRKKFVAGNWKMFTTLSGAIELATGIVKGLGTEDRVSVAAREGQSACGSSLQSATGCSMHSATGPTSPALSRQFDVCRPWPLEFTRVDVPR